MGILEMVREWDLTCFEHSGNISTASPTGMAVQVGMFSRKIEVLNIAFG